MMKSMTDQLHDSLQRYRVVLAERYPEVPEDVRRGMCGVLSATYQYTDVVPQGIENRIDYARRLVEAAKAGNAAEFPAGLVLAAQTWMRASQEQFHQRWIGEAIPAPHSILGGY